MRFSLVDSKVPGFLINANSVELVSRPKGADYSNVGTF